MMGTFNSLVFNSGLYMLLLLLCRVCPAAGQNRHLIDSQPNGFSIYRSGKPDRQDFQNWCSIGIREVMVLSGDSSYFESRYAGDCPALKVIYNQKQDARIPLDAGFLKYFDNWVEDARRNGTKILFRCRCGCHRAGRLAAYYQMKYLGYSPEEAIKDLYKYGKHMQHYGFLVDQINALYDYIHKKPCRYLTSALKQSFCVRNISPAASENY
ncbi:MAG: hypothetical protein D6719_01475 [Candidatus Dadabacteria bacterium]|nr:MAG: hypothetical protein D6719_01475 [Candidatus Dadabacteria bacterium]